MKIFILLLLTITNVFADEYIDHDMKEFEYIHSFDQTSDRYNKKIDIKNLSLKQKEEKKKVELAPYYYNRKNIVSVRMGIQQEEFEEKDGFFVSSVSPSIDFTFYRKIFSRLKMDFDFQLSKNNGIFRQGVLFDIVNWNGVVLSPFIKLGQKLAFTEQFNSGYLFVHTGGSLIYETTKFENKIEVYTSPSSFNKIGIHVESLYKMKDTSAGLYFAKDHYDQMELLYDRQGQSTLRFGFILKY